MKKSSVIILLILIIPFVYAENRAPVANADGNKVIVSGTTVIFDASKSYDLDNNLENIPSTYKWYENGRKIAEGINFRKSYPPGTYKITLEVTDSEGLSSKDDIIVNSRSKQKCKETNAIYPEIIPLAQSKKMPSRTTRVIFGLNDGSALFFNDLRKFGWIKVTSSTIGPTGRDVLAKGFTEKYFRTVLEKTSRSIKSVLMDQDKIAGIGNIYANDALWHAKIHSHIQLTMRQ